MVLSQNDDAFLSEADDQGIAILVESQALEISTKVVTKLPNPKNARPVQSGSKGQSRRILRTRAPV
eukprot:2504138-Amphidinium_carterae.2